MRYLLLVVSALGSSALGLAQTPVVSPPEVANIAASGPNECIGLFRDSRHMLMDGELRGTAMSIKEIAFRMSYWNYDSVSARGRSWTSVTLDLSECDVAKTPTTFGLVPTTTPTRVFQAPMSWPPQIGLPKSRPAPWHIRFPFSSSWAYKGTTDICLDLGFNGGSFPGGGNSHVPLPYWLEGASAFPFATGRSIGFGGSPSQPGCRDGSNPALAYSATWFATMWVYAADHTTQSLRRTVHASIETAGMRGSVITAIGTAGIPAGQTMPTVGCDKLFVDTNQPTAYVASLHGPLNQTIQFPSFLWSPAFANLGIWAQSAWSDSVSGQVKLSPAALSWIPELPRKHRFAHLYSIDPVNQHKTGSYIWWPAHPVMRFAR